MSIIIDNLMIRIAIVDKINIIDRIHVNIRSLLGRALYILA